MKDDRLRWRYTKSDLAWQEWDITQSRVYHETIKSTLGLGASQRDMADSVVIAAVDTIDDSSNNVLAETVNALYKSEVIHS